MVFLNGGRVPPNESRALRHGDCVVIGIGRTFRVEVPGTVRGGEEEAAGGKSEKEEEGEGRVGPPTWHDAMAQL